MTVVYLGRFTRFAFISLCVYKCRNVLFIFCESLNSTESKCLKKTKLKKKVPEKSIFCYYIQYEKIHHSTQGIKFYSPILKSY